MLLFSVLLLWYCFFAVLLFFLHVPDFKFSFLLSRDLSLLEGLPADKTFFEFQTLEAVSLLIVNTGDRGLLIMRSDVVYSLVGGASASTTAGCST